MNHDEIRVVNFCHLCQSRGLTPGQLLADNVSCCIGMIREINPDARIFVWSDMFDPYHNARDNYYLANGTMADSWKGLSTDVVIVNWNYGVRKQSMQWFAEKSFNQIIAGYYDGSVEQIHLWLDDARNIKGIVGVMYTTWKNNYADLESFSKYLQMPQ